MTRELDGLLVVALEHAVAAPYCTALLADGGARVIKVERPGGDFARGYDTHVKGGSAYFVWLNRGKESAVLDLRERRDRTLLDRLVARADVFVQNLGPGAAARAGFGAEALRRRHPRLVTCDISGYGETGPYAGTKAYDLLVQAETGLCSINGSPGAPGRVGISIADIATGAMAYGAILKALLARERTGVGATLKASLFGTLADWLSVPLLQEIYGDVTPGPAGLYHPTIAPYGAYPLGDGGRILIAIQNEREWGRFCDEILGRPELADDPRFAHNAARVANRGAMDEIIAEAFAALDRESAGAALRRADIAHARLNSIADLAAHEQLRRLPVSTPGGMVELVAPSVEVAGETSELGPVPALGAHTERIRREFGDRT
ncbi:MAG: CaiB/BaiF CoA transferase family protein [Alphaproteobacteria bacterium]